MIPQASCHFPIIEFTYMSDWLINMESRYHPNSWKRISYDGDTPHQIMFSERLLTTTVWKWGQKTQLHLELQEGLTQVKAESKQIQVKVETARTRQSPPHPSAAILLRVFLHPMLYSSWQPCKVGSYVPVLSMKKVRNLLRGIWHHWPQMTFECHFLATTCKLKTLLTSLSAGTWEDFIA